MVRRAKRRDEHRRTSKLASNRGMDNLSAIEQRVTDLEIKLGFTEDLVDQLNQVIIRQQQQIDLLTREVMQLRQQTPDDGGAAFRSLRDELPPHY